MEQLILLQYHVALMCINKHKGEQEMCASQNTPVYIKRSCCQKLY